MTFDIPELDTDPDHVTDRILDGLTDRMAGWEAVEGAPEVALAEEVGREIAVLNTTTLDLLDLAAAAVGETAFGFRAYPGTAATIDVTITVTAPGAIIPAGLTVAALTDEGEECLFTLAEAIGVPSGVTAATTLTALEVGTLGNGIPAGPLDIVTVATSVVDVVATSPSTGGQEPEPIDLYLVRLADYLATLRPGGVLADDLAALARTVPGVYRALGVDLHDPAASGTPAERTATVFCVDSTSHALDPATTAAVKAALEAAREVNFVVHVQPPKYTKLSIVYTAVAETGADPAVVQAEISAAIGGWLTSWGSTTGNAQAWVNTTTVRYLDLARIAGSAPGVAYLQSLTLNGGTSNVTLAGPGGLPTPLDATVTPSTITGTVS